MIEMLMIINGGGGGKLSICKEIRACNRKKGGLKC